MTTTSPSPPDIRKLMGALQNAIEDIWWMSAASDFAPTGKAYKEWLNVRSRLVQYEAILHNERPAR